MIVKLGSRTAFITASYVAVSLAASFATWLALSSTPASARELSLKSKFNIAFLGVNVGEMKHSYRLNGDRYEISGKAKSNPFVSLVVDSKASFSSAGTIAGTRLIPSRLNVSWAGRKKGQVKVSYSNDKVASIEAKPKFTYKPGTVPLEKAHLMQVIDPVSSLLFAVEPDQVNDGRKVCDRVLPIFDGRSRINLALSYKSSRTVRVKGFRGKVHTCHIRYQPVSGIRPGKKDVKFMKANRQIEVTMARVGNTNFYALFGFRVRTRKGVASGSAHQFSIN